jgi:hypothetical protein
LTTKCHTIGIFHFIANTVTGPPDEIFLPNGNTGVSVQIGLCGRTPITGTIQRYRSIRPIPDNRRRVMHDRYIRAIPHKPYRVSQLALIPTIQSIITSVKRCQFVAVDASHVFSLFVKKVRIGKVGLADTIGTISLKAADRTFDKIVKKVTIVTHGTILTSGRLRLLFLTIQVYHVARDCQGIFREFSARRYPTTRYYSS